MPPEICPNCGAEVPARAKACPECGADEQTGWSEAAHYESLGLPDDSFDYEDYAKREFGGKRRPRIRGVKLIWQVTAVLLAVGFAYLLWYRWF